MLKAPMIHQCPACSFHCSAEPIAGVICCERCGKNFEAKQAVTIQSNGQEETWIASKGESIDGYSLERKIGQGGMAEVWLAQGPKNKVVIKILLAKLNDNDQIRKRFVREIESLKRFQHEHIIPISDHGESHNRLYYVMPVYASASLRQEMDRRAQKPADVQFLRQLCEQTLQALDHAHQQNVVHRDIKPENILLLDNGNFAVSDFGIAQMHSTHDGQTLTMLTNTNAVLGTYAYMAPEQNRGSRTVDARADLYALGVVLYEALSGNLPEGRFEDPSVYLEHYTEAEQIAWNNFILKLLERDPNNRYQSAQQALAAIPNGTTHAAEKIPKYEHRHYPHGNTLYRYSPHGWVGGVCSGIGSWTGIDAGWIRIGMCVGMFFSAGILFLAYIAAVLILPECPDPQYRPRPLNSKLPRRGDGWFLGVCEMLGQRSGNGAVWRLVFVIAAPFTAFTILIPYLAIGVLFPGPIYKRHTTKRHVRKKHLPTDNASDEVIQVAWGPSFFSNIIPLVVVGYLAYALVTEPLFREIGFCLIGLAIYLSARLHTRIQMTPVNFTGFSSGLAFAGAVCLITSFTVALQPHSFLPGSGLQPIQNRFIGNTLYMHDVLYLAVGFLATGIFWGLIRGYYGAIAITLGLIPSTTAFFILISEFRQDIPPSSPAFILLIASIALISAQLSKYLLRWFINPKPESQRQYSLAASIVGLSLLCCIVLIA